MIVNQDDLRLMYARYMGDLVTLSEAERAALEHIAEALGEWVRATSVGLSGGIIMPNLVIAYAAAKLTDEWQIAEWEKP